VVALALNPALLFIPAGRLDWWEGWVFVLLYAFLVTVMVLLVQRKDPELIEERSDRSVVQKAKPWDRVLMNMHTLLFVPIYVVAGLEAGRYSWSFVPLAIKIIAVVWMFLSFLLILWTMLSNPFLSSYVRIQHDRGQRVVSSGPYAFVRHPMYVVILGFLLGSPLLVGSWCTFIPAGLHILVFLVRTVWEDRTLHAELLGYPEYAQKVRYRLLPGV
jgi:protein-S-isoprenylcysteine O-methyltransferase Ste14